MATVFRESRLAHKILDGLKGWEIGPAAHNPFGLNTRYMGIPGSEEYQIKMCGRATRLDVVALGDAIPLKTESEDFIISSHVIEHCPNLIKSLLEWFRVIKVNGYIFVIAPLRDAEPDDVRRPLSAWSHFVADYLGDMTLCKEPEPLPPSAHCHVFSIESLNECFFRVFGARLKLVAMQNRDDKVGNGFTLAYQKVISWEKSFPWPLVVSVKP
ncbi:MAG: methyltransferase domain-containing protein [Verrucomicrobiae bacterium]|nr:methyltransferase domain-containing protein [Verrucomicrobiae bacterium]